jgi:hypothetical protein
MLDLDLGLQRLPVGAKMQEKATLRRCTLKGARRTLPANPAGKPPACSAATVPFLSASPGSQQLCGVPQNNICTSQAIELLMLSIPAQCALQCR